MSNETLKTVINLVGVIGTGVIIYGLGHASGQLDSGKEEIVIMDNRFFKLGISKRK